MSFLIKVNLTTSFIPMSTGTDITAPDSEDNERAREIIKKKKKPILKLLDGEEEEEKEERKDASNNKEGDSKLIHI